ncbi:hypothetical protein [Piscirickettsia litoralis]|nr:hypothetical protein [Piscirickettsia litoralis]
MPEYQIGAITWNINHINDVGECTNQTVDELPKDADILLVSAQ